MADDRTTLRERWLALGQPRQAATIIGVAVLILAAIWFLS